MSADPLYAEYRETKLLADVSYPYFELSKKRLIYLMVKIPLKVDETKLSVEFSYDLNPSQSP